MVRLRDEIAASEIGGVMFLKTNVASLSKVKAMNAGVPRRGAGGAAAVHHLDQEGGAVERLTKDVGFAEIPTRGAGGAEPVAGAGGGALCARWRRGSRTSGSR